MTNQEQNIENLRRDNATNSYFEVKAKQSKEAAEFKKGYKQALKSVKIMANKKVCFAYKARLYCEHSTCYQISNIFSNLYSLEQRFDNKDWYE